MLSQLFLFALMLMVGMLVAVQIRTQSRARTVAFTSNEQAILLSELVTANQSLRNEISAIEKQQRAYQTDSQGTVLEELVAELNRVKVANGAVEVSGPGIELMLDGPLTALDMQDVINELRNAGAEAIAVNDLRLVIHSTLSIDSAKQLLIDDQSIGQPYQFHAIGDPNTMETALLRPGSVLDLMQRAYPDLVVQIKQYSRLVLPVHRSPTTFTFARAVE
ncbi:MAG: DUF881 domain-containing protein [Anaerolineae bacterium]|nr:DUF881 domain-containing protein [Anaerolineae bacterium]